MTDKTALWNLKHLIIPALTEAHHRESVETAMKALEKQIPRMPHWNDEEGAYLCPVCDLTLNRTDGNPRFCDWCGQAIKWEGIPE